MSDKLLRTVTVVAAPYDYPMPVHSTALMMIDFQKDFMMPGGFGDALGNDVSLLKVRMPMLQNPNRVAQCCYEDVIRP